MEKKLLQINERRYIMQLPEKPYASDKLKYGLRIMTREEALKKKYIELNPVHVKKFITFDIDYDIRKDEIWYFEEEMNMPAPYWTVVNPENGHAHFIYVLKTPVFCTEAAHIKPLKYLDAVVKAMTRVFKADPRYCGLISKNPFNKKDWFIKYPYWNKPEEVTLGMLANCPRVIDYLYEEPHAPVDEDIAGLGRNCFIFEHVRVRAYRERRYYFGKTYDDWRKRVHHMCEEENATFAQPLGEREIAHITKSITDWTFGEITPEGFREAQRNRVRMRWSRESRKREGQELLKSGCTVAEVMELLDVSRRTVFNWKRELSS